MKNLITSFLLLITAFAVSYSDNNFEKDEFVTTKGKFTIYFIGHGTLMIDYKGLIIYIDPISNLADYSKMQKADIILITHHHPDHMDKDAIAKISKNNTKIILTKDCYEVLKKGIIMKNGDKKNLSGIEIEAVPAYNLTKDKEKFHPKGRDNGYIIKIVNKRIYIAGDTENIPEMSTFKNIDIAFLPMNQPYTMLPEQTADAARKVKPKILYPYHTGDTDVSQLVKLLSDEKNIEVRVRKLK